MTLIDNHALKRGEIQNCESCRFYFPTPVGGHGNCHRFPPPSANSGHVTVYAEGWCGEYTADAEKIAEFGDAHFKMRKEQLKVKSQQHKEIGTRLKATQPKIQNQIATKPLK